MSTRGVGFIGLAVIAVSVFCGGGSMGISMGRDAVRFDAVKAGVAEWVVVDEMGTTEFRWKKPLDQKAESK